MTMIETRTGEPVPYDFERAIPHDEVAAQFLLPYLEEEETFRTISEKVAEGNRYIKNGEAPTGLRDLEFSYDVGLTHIPSGEYLGFTREDLEDMFTVIKKGQEG